MIAEIGGKVALEWIVNWIVKNAPNIIVGPLKEQIAILQADLDEHKRIRSAVDKTFTALSSDDTGLWRAKEPFPPFADYNDRIGRIAAPGSAARRPAIITLINYKGGVGKTTTAANLAAYFDGIGKRVLLLDLDYQGSLTTVLEAVSGRQDRSQGIVHLLERGDSATLLSKATVRLGAKLARSSLAPAFYGLARAEERIMMEWLLDIVDDDVRYRLARILLDDGLSKQYDIVLIDAPPRLTTASINALCASTHVLVPAIFDKLSSEPVVNFIAETQTLMNRLNPRLSFLGILETMVPPANWSRDPRQAARELVLNQLSHRAPSVAILETSIKRNPELTGGGLGTGDVKKMFAELGEEISSKLGVI